MKTSNKILITTAIIIVIGMFFQSFILRKTYLKLIANPQSSFEKIDFRTVRYLNIKHHWNVNIKQADKFQVFILKEYKDSLRYNYIGDSLNLDGRNAGEITIYLPKLPILKFQTIQSSQNEGLEINFDNSFKNGDLIAKMSNYVYVKLDASNFENVNISSKENIKIELYNSDIKNFNLNLPKHSEIEINYSKIGSKNFILADSCSLKITGKNEAIPGKYYGTVLK